MARALREQWADDDLARRDKAKMGTVYLAGEDEEADDLAWAADDDDTDLAQLSEEAREAYAAEQATVQEALAVLQQQKTTLKEARWRQKQIKLGRNFFPAKEMPRSSASSSGKGGIKYFHCGGPHRIAECPKRGKQQVAQNAEEAAEVASHATTVEEEFSLHADILDEQSVLVGSSQTLDSVLEKCFGVIDSGATARLGSIEALEAVVDKNLQETGASKVDVDVDRKPTFRFGNGQKRQDWG